MLREGVGVNRSLTFALARRVQRRREDDMDVLRAIWPSRADIDRAMINPPRHALWEQRAIGATILVASVGLYGSLAWWLASLLMGLV